MTLETLQTISEEIARNAERAHAVAQVREQMPDLCPASPYHAAAHCLCVQSFGYDDGGALTRERRCCRCGETESARVAFVSEVTL